MKCPNCKGTLNLEHKFCPHCGTLNEHAKKHIENMKKYQKDYEETKTEVYEKAHKNSEITSKSVILAVLLFVLFACLSSYSLLEEIAFNNRYEKEKKLVEENKEKLINARDYYIYGRVSYDHIYYRYSTIYDAIMTYQQEKSSERKYFKSQSLIDEIIKFYKETKEENMIEYHKISKEDIKNIEIQIKALLVAYCNFTKEETDNLENLSNGELTLLLEEKLNETER